MLSQANPRLMLMILSAVFAFLYIPISVLFALSFNEGGLPTAWTGFSVKWYGELVRNDEIIGAALNTLIVIPARLASTRFPEKLPPCSPSMPVPRFMWPASPVLSPTAWPWRRTHWPAAWLRRS